MTADYTDGTDGELGLEVREIWFGRFLSSHYALPFEANVLEVKEECEIESGNVQVSDHLCDVRVGKCFNDFRIDDDRAIYDQIRDEGAD